MHRVAGEVSQVHLRQIRDGSKDEGHGRTGWDVADHPGYAGELLRFTGCCFAEFIGRIWAAELDRIAPGVRPARAVPAFAFHADYDEAVAFDDYRYYPR